MAALRLFVTKLVDVALFKRRSVTWATAADKFEELIVVKIACEPDKLVVVTDPITAFPAPKFVTNKLVLVALPKVTLFKSAMVAAKLVVVTEVNRPLSALRLVALRLVDVALTTSKLVIAP